MTTLVDWNDGDWSRALGEARLRPSDIAETISADEGCYDGEGWLAVVRLTQAAGAGRFALIYASCCYTGWGCNSGGGYEEAGTLADLCRLVMDADQRARLGYDVFGERV